MFSTYKPEDVTLLLKDISGLIQPLSTTEREKNIQSGVHYSEMLPIEYEPSEEYMRLYKTALYKYAAVTAEAVARVSLAIWEDKDKDTVLVSLARAGTSVGVLIKHYLDKYFKVCIPHYTISIIRDRGIDKNAMKYILERYKPEQIQFVDGWTGKGTIQRELDKAMTDFPRVDSGLAVLSDPAYLSKKSGTHEDFLIASSCLNSTVSGLISRTFLRGDIIGENDFHGVVFYENLMNKDMTYQFINTVEDRFPNRISISRELGRPHGIGLEEAYKICNEFGINNINFVKPGIGETTRVLLRRVPWKILVHSMCDNENLGHIYRLAKEKNVKLIEYPLVNYKACGLICNLADS